MSQICDRCGSPTYATSMSYFNTDTICMECDSLEQLHPDYPRAKAVELEQVESGNFSYEGIGLPEGYREWVRAKKADLASVEAGPEVDEMSHDEKIAVIKELLDFQQRSNDNS